MKRFISRRDFLKVTGAVGAGSLLAACGGSSSSTGTGAASAGDTADGVSEKKLTVTWWGNQTRNERTIATLDLYSELNPGVTFDPQVAEWADYWNKLATASAGKALPDIIQMDYKYLDQYIKNGLLTDLNPYVEDGTLDVSTMDEGILNSGKGADGGLYAICIGENAPALVYNKTLLDENGITVKDNMTVDEFKALCKEIYEKTGYKSNYYYNQGENNLEFVLRAKDIVLFEEGKLGAASADDFNQYFAVFEDGIKEGWMLPASSFAERNIGTIEQDPPDLRLRPRQPFLVYLPVDQLPERPAGCRRRRDGAGHDHLAQRRHQEVQLPEAGPVLQRVLRQQEPR